MAYRERYGEKAAFLYCLAIDPIVRPLRPRIADVLRDRRTQAVLDVACATGAQARFLAARGLQVVGVDLSLAMTARAARRSPEIPFICASALSLPFPTDSFDGAILSLALHEHPEEERQAMVSEALRVLRPTGTLVIADFSPPRRARWHLPWQAIRLIEHTAGPEHREGFRDYVRHGALAGLLARLALVADEAQASHFGCISIVAVTKSAASSH
jgi:demethylmenaquinone methyltransferase/2-methoxy-6-polyprenyl-1,4-benzoquinol methylase